MSIMWTVVGILIGLAAAHTRGFSPLFGGIVGFLLGPFALLMFFASGGRKCQHCLSAIPPKATVCAKCGREQREDGEVAAPSQDEIDDVAGGVG